MGFGVNGSVVLQMVTAAAMRAGFSGGLVVDFPNSSKAKKFYLVLMVGQPSEPVQLQGLTGEEGRGGVEVVRTSPPLHLRRMGPGCQSAHRSGSQLSDFAQLRGTTAFQCLESVDPFLIRPLSMRQVSRQHKKSNKRRCKKALGPTNLSARHPESKGKAWVHRKKANMRAKGVPVPNDSRCTAQSPASARLITD